MTLLRIPMPDSRVFCHRTCCLFRHFGHRIASYSGQRMPPAGMRGKAAKWGFPGLQREKRSGLIR
jgi:hypothetical protein